MTFVTNDKRRNLVGCCSFALPRKTVRGAGATSCYLMRPPMRPFYGPNPTVPDYFPTLLSHFCDPLHVIVIQRITIFATLMRPPCDPFATPLEVATKGVIFLLSFPFLFIFVVSSGETATGDGLQKVLRKRLPERSVTDCNTLISTADLSEQGRPVELSEAKILQTSAECKSVLSFSH